MSTGVSHGCPSSGSLTAGSRGPQRGAGPGSTRVEASRARAAEVGLEKVGSAEILRRASLLFSVIIVIPSFRHAGSQIAAKEIGRATSELQSQSNLVCRLLLEKKKKKTDEKFINKKKKKLNKTEKQK